MSYSFDEETLEAGPDTFAVFEQAKGTVHLSTDFRLSGYRSVEIRDVAFDRDFPELQGYFALRQDGKVYAHFALLITDPAETLNLALAGPRGFALQKDAIAFWLKTRNRFLYHYSDSIPKKLFPVRAFTWYIVDLQYDIGAGIYDLRIREEGSAEPMVELARQQNASNQPGSAIDKFSFIGDLAWDDTSNVVYYVDDVVISVDEPIPVAQFAAPGRRRLFVDAWREQRRTADRFQGCLPVIALTDVGIGREEEAALETDGLVDFLGERLNSQRVFAAVPEGASPASARVLDALRLWKYGCAALRDGDPSAALAKFRAASDRAPAAPIYRLSMVLAQAGLKRWEEADALFAELGLELADDFRLAHLSARMGLARNRLEEAELALQRPFAEFSERLANPQVRTLWSETASPRIVEALRARFPTIWLQFIEEWLICQEYFYVQLWNDRYTVAENFAQRLAGKLEALDVPAGHWLERAGDAALLGGDPQRARDLYEQALTKGATEASVFVRLSDVHHLLGDLEKERLYREKVYGSLHEALEHPAAPELPR